MKRVEFPIRNPKLIQIRFSGSARLFDRTIRKNIRMGRPGASDEEVENVAEAVGWKLA